MSIVSELKIALQNIAGKTVTSGDSIEEVLKAFNDSYSCAVTFTLTPETATLVVKDSDSNVISPAEDGKYYLKAGSYTYDVTAEGYTAKENQTLTITTSDETTGTKTVTVTLSVAS